MLQRRLALSVSALALATGVPAIAHAQSGTGAEDATADVILVTARKREEVVQDIPITLDSFNRAQIEDFAIESLEDIESLVTGAEFIGDQGDPYQKEIVIRGGGVARQLNVDSGTGLYFNGISIQGGNLGGRSLGAIDTFDMERVEVLKGPQGALYGRNALGGAVNLISRRPDLDTASADLEALIADNAGLGLEAAGDIVIAPGSAAVRLVGRRYEQDEGFYYNPYLGTFMDTREETTLRAVGLFQISPAWELVLQADYFEGEREGDTVYDQITVDDPFNWSQDDLARSTREEQNYYAAVSGELGWAQLDVIVNYRDRVGDRLVDDDQGVAQDPFDPSAQTACIAAMMGAYTPNQRCTTTTDGAFEKLSVEARLIGSQGALDWIIGADAFDSADVYRQEVVGQAFNSFELDLSNDVSSWSAFAGGEYAFTDRLSMGVEGRWTDEQKDLVSLAQLTYGPVAGLAIIDNDTTQDFGYFTWAAYASYQMTERLRGFARVGSGFRTGGLNTDGRDITDPATGVVVDVPDFYDEERAISYEVGFKSEPTGRLTFNGAIYYISYEDFISNANNGLTGLNRVSYVTNLGDAELYGAELELAGRGFETDGGLRVNWSVGAAYGRGEITDGADPSDNGLLISRVPEWSWTAQLDASVPAILDSRAFAAVSYSGQEGGFQTYNNNTVLPEPHVVNLNLGLRADRWGAQLTVRNLFDEDELVRNSSGPDARSMAREPRTWMLRLSRHFGG